MQHASESNAHFFLSIDDEGRQNKKKKTAPVDTGSYTLKKETVNSLVYFRLVVAMIFFYSFSPTFLFSRLFFFTWGLLLKWLYIH